MLEGVPVVVGDTQAYAVWITQASGSHTLEVSTLGLSTIVGTYELTLAGPRPATPEDQRRLLAQSLRLESRRLVAQPDRERLAQAGEKGRPQDGFLRLQDVYNLKLNADLVVLGACETGLGKEVRAEGLVGLSGGFMYAGVPRLLASLWKVDEEATIALLREFHRAVRRGHPFPSALREAQQQVRQQRRWSSPYFWAGFVLQGEWRGPETRNE